MIGKIRFLGGMRGFAQKAINRLENGKSQIQRRELRMIFCAGDEEPDEVELRNNRARQEIVKKEDFEHENAKQENEVVENDKSNLSETNENGHGQNLNNKGRLRFVCGDEDLEKRENISQNDPQVWATQQTKQRFVQGDDDLKETFSQNNFQKTSISQEKLPRMRFRPMQKTF